MQAFTFILAEDSTVSDWNCTFPKHFTFLHTCYPQCSNVT